MAGKMNHARPSLRYADNIRRELRIAANKYEEGSRLSRERSSQSGFDSVWNAMVALGLSDAEEKAALDFIEQATKQLDVSTEAISLLFVKSKKKKRLALQEEADALYERLMTMGIGLVAMDAVAREAGRHGVLDWFELLETELANEDGCDFVFEALLESSERLAKMISDHEKSSG